MSKKRRLTAAARNVANRRRETDMTDGAVTGSARNNSQRQARSKMSGKK
jgi:hypothetical protein